MTLSMAHSEKIERTGEIVGNQHFAFLLPFFLGKLLIDSEKIKRTGETVGNQHFAFLLPFFLRKLFIDSEKINSRFVWANGRAAGIGITIPVCSIGRLLLLEPLLSLPNIEWKRRQSFRNKMAEAANETSFEEFFFF